jgi:hypothetical protein
MSSANNPARRQERNDSTDRPLQPDSVHGITVWIDFWQMQCCGEPFGLSTQIAWTLRALERDWIGEVLGPDAPLTADATEDAQP